MGLFSNLFGKKSSKDKDPAIFYAQQDKLMQEATKNAQDNFKYFWRALYWEYRRIIPAHDFAMIKIPFEQEIKGHTEPIVEHMWTNQITFDGTLIKGELVNEPNQLTNVKKGDEVLKKIEEIGDWMISIHGKTYGGFTVQVMRSGMTENERKNHDKAWGLDFGDYNEVLVVHQQKENADYLIEHPMSENMGEKFQDFLKENPNEASLKDENGLSMLHKEAIAGNRTIIEILLASGADKSVTCNKGKTALDYAKKMNWEHLVPILD